MAILFITATVSLILKASTPAFCTLYYNCNWVKCGTILSSWVEVFLVLGLAQMPQNQEVEGSLPANTIFSNEHGHTSCFY